MNLIIHINTDLLTFFEEANNKVKYLPKLKTDLYFFYDKYTKTIKSHKKYKLFFIEKKEYFFGDIIDNISKNNTVKIGEDTHNYIFFINNILVSLPQTYDKAYIIWSSQIPNDVREKIDTLFIEKFKECQIATSSMTELIAKNYIINNRQSEIKELYVAENYTNIINLSKIQIENTNFSIIDTKLLKNKLFDPFKYTFSNNIAEEIIKNYQIPNSSITANSEYIYLKIGENYQEALKKQKDFVIVNSTILNSTERYSVRIGKNTLSVLSENYAKSIISEIEKNADAHNTILLIGKYFDNNYIQEKINQSDKNFQLLNIEEVLSTAESEIIEEDEYSTMFIENKEEIYVPTDDFVPIQTLELATLHEGNLVKLTNMDKNKGKSIQIFEYIDTNKFKVIDSTRSLQFGDIIEANSDKWQAGLKIIVDVFRNNKKYGKFKTREIQSVEIKK